ncbi:MULTISPECIES: SCO3242 family prenyltransferase [unclassified Actinopolyspora]|uniref:SCO3242 family prenyltransferase n=1 Tax=unclassified Actinopolyspora TaxID=2639451 RepID=UPI0013F64D23|nr:MULTISPECIES: UbiA family prenyltransferase [unclassified Actinopolyspora]NHD19104.1 UbiA family prenyltransferase [Actinopolyspora sp. BKK2]NHE78111.1 UbiA family prenyltransferase [Actinopolyspora sp. BKK1]
MRVRALVELLRAPAALSVPGDVLAGAGTDRSPARDRALRTFGSCCLYWAGMALNDYVDRDVDAAERPRRPVPSGRVPAPLALGLSVVLTAAGLAGSAGSGGRRSLAVALPLATTVWSYNLGLKGTAAGPAAMATARALDVLHGAEPGRLHRAVPAATAVGAHTLALSTVAAAEVTGSAKRLPAGALATTLGLGTAVAAWLVTSAASRGRGGPDEVLGACALAVYTTTVGRGQLAAVRTPGPAELQRATSGGILGMIPLQSALTAARGSGGRAAVLLGLLPVARALSGRVSPT